MGDITVFEAESDRQWCGYFFDYNEFHRYRAILDGAIISEIAPTEVSAQLVLNSLSPRYDRFRSSRLVEAFSSGLLDPLRIESEGDAIIVGSDADRTSEQTKLDYLASKYGIQNPFIIRMAHMAAMLRSKPLEG
jgi:hypothetical protein